MKTKKIYFVILIITITLMLCNGTVKGALQSNGNTPAVKTVSDWMPQIRQMEALGGTLGLSTSVNTTDLTGNNKELDIHMEKNTEYGAMAILSASSYGNPNKIENGGTTTGNKSGAVMKLNKEWVAAGCSDFEPTIFKNALNRYKNVYQGNYVRKNGDSIDIGAWQGAGSLFWYPAKDSPGSHWTDTRWSGVLRAHTGSIFSYYARSYEHSSLNGNISYDAAYTKAYASRAAIVVGTGI